MAFGIGTNTQKSEAGKLKGRQLPIACKSWFTKNGRCMPLLFKFQDEDGSIKTVNQIYVHKMEEKYYCGELSLEYTCDIVLDSRLLQVRLIFFAEAHTWVVNWEA